MNKEEMISKYVSEASWLEKCIDSDNSDSYKRVLKDRLALYFQMVADLQRLEEPEITDPTISKKETVEKVEGDRMKKDKEWLKRQVKTQDIIMDKGYIYIKDIMELVDELEEQEITEEQAWEAIERANHQHIAPADVWKYKEAIQKGILPSDISKPELPVIPKFVAKWIEYIKENRSWLSLYGVLRFSIRTNQEMKEWILKDNSELFSKAWLDGYTIEPPKKYKVKVSGELYFVRYDELEVVVIRNSAPGFIERAKLFDNKEEAEKVADDVNGYVEELPEDEAMKLIEGWKGNE